MNNSDRIKWGPGATIGYELGEKVYVIDGADVKHMVIKRIEIDENGVKYVVGKDFMERKLKDSEIYKSKFEAKNKLKEIVNNL